MSKLKVISGPEGWDFQFSIANGVLRVINPEFPDKPWDLPVNEQLLPGHISVLQGFAIRRSVSTLILRLVAPVEENDILKIVIVGLIPDEPLEWIVSLSEFNQLLLATDGKSFAELKYTETYKTPPGDMWIDFGPE